MRRTISVLLFTIGLVFFAGALFLIVDLSNGPTYGREYLLAVAVGQIGIGAVACHFGRTWWA